MKKIILCALVIVAFLKPVTIQASEDLKAQIVDLQNRIQALELEKTKGAPVVAPRAVSQDGGRDAEKARLEIYGVVQTDLIYDVHAMDPNWTGTLRASKIAVNCPGDAGCGKNGETTFSIRQSRLGVKGFIPTALGELKTQFEFDLFGLGRDEGKTTFHLAKAWAELGPFLVGQTHTLIMDVDVFPNTFNYWGPSGMTYLGNPQFRWTPLRKNGLKLSLALEEPAARVDSNSLGLGGVSEKNRLPDLTAQFRVEKPWGHYQLAGIVRWLGYQPDTVGTGPSGSKAGYGISMGGNYKIFKKDQILAQVNVGTGISNYINDFDCCADIATDSSGNAKSLMLAGWLLYYDHFWSDRWSSTLGWSEIYQKNTSGQMGSAFKMADYGSVNLVFYPIKPMKMGPEVIYVRRKNNDDSTGNDTRIQFSAKYIF